MPLFAPNYIIESNGVACGDYIALYAYTIRKKLFFAFANKACSYSNYISSYLEQKYYGKDIDAIKSFCDCFRLKSLSQMEKLLGLNIPMCRKKCCMSPIMSMLELVTQIESEKKCSLPEVNLACDACVNVKHVQWENELNEVIEKNPKEYVPSEDDNSILQRMGLIGQDDFFEKNFLSIKWNAENKANVKKMRLAAPLLNNAKSKGFPVNLWLDNLVCQQMISIEVAKQEISLMEKYIKKEALVINPVKGNFVSAFYPSKACRPHMDFDYLAKSLSDAILLVDYLINKRNFKLVLNGSVPFSFKDVKKDDEELLTGHIHLEKILQDRYQVIVDINIIAFPIGRVGAMYYENMADIETQICITLAHLFKHKYPFAKDLNDLYYLFRKKIDVKKLKNHLLKSGLTFEFLAAKKYFEERVAFSIPIFFDEYIPWEQLDFKNWPYSTLSHLLLKKYFLTKKCKAVFGERIGTREADAQINNSCSKIKTKKYKNLCPYFNQRIMLYPVVLFKQIVNVRSTCFTKVEDVMYEYKQLVILPIGIFLNMQSKYTRISVERSILYVLKVLKVGEKNLNFTFFANARKDLWLY